MIRRDINNYIYIYNYTFVICHLQRPTHVSYLKLFFMHMCVWDPDHPFWIYQFLKSHPREASRKPNHQKKITALYKTTQKMELVSTFFN